MLYYKLHKSRILQWRFYIFCPAILCLIFSHGWGFDSSFKTTDQLNLNSFDGKKSVIIEPIQGLSIELPDGSVRDFSKAFEASLTSQLLQSGKYWVTSTDLSQLNSENIKEEFIQDQINPQYHWSGSITPPLRIQFDIKAMFFETGLRGGKLFYGFSENIYNPPLLVHDEFPLKTLADRPTSWFGSSYLQKGIPPFDSRSGLDLGDGFKLDALFAWLNIKYAHYHSEFRFKLNINTPTQSQLEFGPITVSSNGFYFDAVAGYENYSAGIIIARKDAIERTLKRAINGSYEIIEKNLAQTPLYAKIDAVLPDGTILLGTGPFSQVKPGVIYELVSSPRAIIQVYSSEEDGSIGRLIQGNIQELKVGALLKQITEIPQFDHSITHSQNNLDPPSSNETHIQLSDLNLPIEPLLNNIVPDKTRLQAFLQSIAEGATLPYRIWRYFSYNQTYHRTVDLGISKDHFHPKWQKEKWVHQIGLDKLPKMEGKQSVIVAIIDSGLDYNHPWIHDSIWINSKPSLSTNGEHDRYGWDFISNDSKPYDDNYHGTQIGSLVSRIAPAAKIMSLKIFDPWGITHSSAIYSAFLYAVDHGANIILCPWSTSVASRAIRDGIEYAQNHDVVIVGAAGDFGYDLARHSIYPAALSPLYDHLIIVGGVDSEDHLVSSSNFSSNYDQALVQISAPGKNISVAEPRLGLTYETSTGLAAAIVAGGIARIISSENENLGSIKWIETLFKDSDSIPSLIPMIELGRRIYLRR